MRCESVLIIEDNSDIREALEQVLRDEGYRVYAVQNGKEAISALKKIPGSPLILLDMMMPVMDGWEFLEKQTSMTAFKAFPVVIVSALGADATLVSKKVPLTAVGYIKKPIPLDDLLDVVAKYCSPQPLHAERIWNKENKAMHL